MKKQKDWGAMSNIGPSIEAHEDVSALQDRIDKVIQIKEAAAERARRRYASIQPVEYTVKAGDATITQEGYPYYS